MSISPTDMTPRTERTLRIAGWLFAAGLLALPAIAMQFSDEVDWSAADFLIAGIALGLSGGIIELGARASANLAFRIGAVVAVGCAFLQAWINAAVGIIGDEGNPANWTYFAVVAIAAAGAVGALGNPRGLARTMVAAASAQAIFSILHAANGTPTIVIDAFFVLLWLLAARLFQRSAGERTGNSA
ncbi:hypothetical protein N0B51_04390 [Tsuneonella sp. YG55]|uniref:Uncharacterized protein n=1 Tax=Tsuneonella litorea TaxID=2976475 RepID=A0A9X3AMC2_9SPHN|nr:hypothetical protein [Tsuneonella litorea]MCT2558212.1 hypothetical protein [Tsuneonella litorea]